LSKVQVKENASYCNPRVEKTPREINTLRNSIKTHTHTPECYLHQLFEGGMKERS